jgi:glutathione S-transferase
MLPVATMGLYYFKAKYQFGWNKSDDYIKTMRNGLKMVRSQLDSKGEYLLGEFTYADIAIAVTLQMVEPIDQQYIALDENTQNCWRTPVLSEEFADLLEWRDRLYKKHRHV